MFELRWIAEKAPEARAVVSGARKSRERIAWTVAARAVVAGLAAALGLYNPGGTPQLATRPLMRLALALPASAPMAIEDQTSLALSPDGTSLVYVARTAAGTQLYLRSLDRVTATPIAGTEGASLPFFSPDGQWVAFFAQRKLQKVRVGGGTPVTVAEASETSRGGSWAQDDTIIYTPEVNAGLMRVSANGGTPQVLTTPNASNSEISHRWMEATPDGESLLFTIWAGCCRWEEARIAVLSLRTGEQRILPLDGAADPRYSETGHLLFRRAGSLMAVPFDLERLQVTGQPVTIVDNIATSLVGSAHLAVSRSGLIVYATADAAAGRYTLSWVDRSGRETPVGLASRALEEPRVSPDGQRVVMTMREANIDVWVYHLGGGELKRLTVDTAEDETPVWMPDNQRVTFSAARVGQGRSVFRKQADGSADEELLLRADAGKGDHPHADGWSPDGESLALTNPVTSSGNTDIWILRPRDNPPLKPLLQTQFREGGARFSPDGRWLAYVSNETGRDEVYVRPFPGPGEKQQVSLDGGTEPTWPRTGGELFFRNGEKMMAVAVGLQPTFSAAKPRVLFEGRYAGARRGRLQANYDVAPDGQRFLMLKEIGQTSVPQLNLMLDALAAKNSP